MTEPVISVLEDPARALAELLAEHAARGGNVVLTGGSSVGPPYGEAAALEPDWHRVTLWWGDERCVPPDDERSNFGLARATLLERLARQPELHRMRGELPPAEAARAYDDELEGVELDLMLLGIGPDGHVASLFPGTPQLAEREARVTSGPARLEPFVERVTMTLPALLSARRIVVFAVGAGKADAIARAFTGPITAEVPGSLLRTGEVPIEVLCDAAAAGSATC